MEMDEIYDFIIIGGGISGLTAAWELKKRDSNLNILVLEAKDRLGGRTLTETLPTAHGTDSFDIGGQWVASSHKNMLNLLDELNLEIYPQYTTGKKLLQFTNQPIRSYSGSIPDMSLVTLLDLENSLRKIDKLGKEFSMDNFRDHPLCEELNSSNVKQMAKQVMWTDDALRMLDMAVEPVFGTTSSQLSALFFIRYSGTAGGFRRLIETSKGCAQELRVKGGTQQISQLLASKMGQESVKLSCPVAQIKQTENYVLIITNSGQEFKCKRALITIPLPQNVHIEFDPPLPTIKTFLCRNMPMANYVKFVAVYDRAFWRDKGLSGEIVNEGKFEDTFEAVDLVYDGTTSNGNPALVGFQTAQRSIWWSDRNEDERRQAILVVLARFLGDEALAPISFLIKNWYHEPYNGGCPTSFCGPGVMDKFHHWQEPFGRLHWGGTETSAEWMGYMEGAVSSGKRVALEAALQEMPELLTESERLSLKRPKSERRKSQIFRQTHKVFRYTVGLALTAIGIVVFKKMYFRIAL